MYVMKSLNIPKSIIILSFTFSYLDDVLLLNSYLLGDFVKSIYSIYREIKDITDTARSVSYLDLHLKIDSGGRLISKL